MHLVRQARCLRVERVAVTRRVANSIYNCTMKGSDFFWLVGILEGEASFIKGPPSRPYCPYVCLQMSDEDVIARVASLWGATTTDRRVSTSVTKICSPQELGTRRHSIS